MAVVPTWMVDPKKIEAAVHRAESALRPVVERIRHTLKDDWSGDPAIYFKVLLTDESVRDRQKLFPLTKQIEDRILEEVQPYDQGLLPYFNYRTISEQAALNDPAWN